VKLLLPLATEDDITLEIIGTLQQLLCGQTVEMYRYITHTCDNQRSALVHIVTLP